MKPDIDLEHDPLTFQVSLEAKNFLDQEGSELVGVSEQ